LILPAWTYHGRGYSTNAGTELALASAAYAREHHGYADEVA
jgi:hypothetical protein